MTSMKSERGSRCRAGIVYPRWDLLKRHLEAKGPGYHTAEEREEVVHQSLQRADEVRDDDEEAWQIWDRFEQLRQQSRELVFPSEEEVLDRIFSRVQHDEGLITLCYRGPNKEVPSRGTKRRKQDTEPHPVHCSLHNGIIGYLLPKME